jgi:predicted nucleic acid-binding protein
MAVLIREAVDALIRGDTAMSADERRRRALRVVGRFTSGSGDVSARHDDYLEDGGDALVAHTYVLVETCALAQRRLGPAAVRAVHYDVLPSLRLVWVDERVHAAGMTACLAAARRDISLVDWISFEVMRAHGVEQAFAFEVHFREQGFTLIP